LETRRPCSAWRLSWRQRGLGLIGNRHCPLVNDPEAKSQQATMSVTIAREWQANYIGAKRSQQPAHLCFSIDAGLFGAMGFDSP